MPRLDPRHSDASGLRIGSVFGVPIYVAPTWFLLAALITWWFASPVADNVPGIGPWRYAVSLSFAVLLSVSVLVHELSHTVMALRAGLPVRRIRLYLLGGASEIEKLSATPAMEARISAAGPIVSLLLGGAAFAASTALERGTVSFVLASALLWSNLVLGVFNLLPGLPLDGGRVLSAIVWQATGDRHTGTIAAAWTGRAVAAGVLFLPSATSAALGGRPDLADVLWGALLASFIWSAAGQSLDAATMARRIPGLSARRLVRRALVVPPDLPLAEALRRAGEDATEAIVVSAGSGDVAIVNAAAVTATPEERRPWIPVADVARRVRPDHVVSVELAGEGLIMALTSDPRGEYLVLEDDGRVLGVLLVDDVNRELAHRP